MRTPSKHGKMAFKRWAGLSAVLVLLSIPVFASPSAKKEQKEGKAGGVNCTRENIDFCYEQALSFFRNGNFEKAKDYFEKVIAVDWNYRLSTKYLKKCHAKLAQEAIARQAYEQRRAREESKRIAAEKRLQGRTPALGAYAPQELRAGGYRIGIGDVLEISVWRNSDLDKNVIVRPDGVISYPLVGDLPTVGLTLTELDEKLTVALTDYVRNPVVSVAVSRFGGTKIIVLGEVRGPGIYSPPGGGNVIDVIALAGGFTVDAVRRGTFLIRSGVQGPEVYRLNLARVFKGDLGQNIPVRSNDIIFVPKTFTASLNHMVTQITPLLSNTLLTTSVIRDLQDLAK